MAIKELEPRAAYEFLRANPDPVYLDVRTEGEFAQGHPEGAINVPVVFMKGPGQMEPNEDFIAVVEKALQADCKLVVGCMAGGRSRRACEILEGVGRANLINVRGGFGGARDGSGAIIVVGWLDEGLPVSTATGEAGYAALRTKAGIA